MNQLRSSNILRDVLHIYMPLVSTYFVHNYFNVARSETGIIYLGNIFYDIFTRERYVVAIHNKTLDLCIQFVLVQITLKIIFKIVVP